MKKYGKLIILCLILLISIFEMKSQKIKVDKKLDSIIRLGLKQNLFYSYVKNHEVLDNKGLFYNFPCENWEMNIDYIKKIDSLLPGYYGLVVMVYDEFFCKKYVNYRTNRIFNLGIPLRVLFAVNKKDFELIIISTNMNSKALVRSNYAHIFNLSEKTRDYSQFIPYIKLQGYFDKLKNIKYIKKNRKWIYFSALEKTFEEYSKTYIKVNRKNVNEVINLGWKISGKYTSKEKIKIG